MAETPMNPNCTLGIQNQARIVSVEANLGRIEAANAQMAHDIADMRSTLLGRPSWAVTTIISTLLSLVTTMAMWIITRGG